VDKDTGREAGPAALPGAEAERMNAVDLLELLEIHEIFEEAIAQGDDAKG
jgi:hypothetical protein